MGGSELIQSPVKRSRSLQKSRGWTDHSRISSQRRGDIIEAVFNSAMERGTKFGLVSWMSLITKLVSLLLDGTINDMELPS
jgi:hypothetical protein